MTFHSMQEDSYLLHGGVDHPAATYQIDMGAQNACEVVDQRIRPHKFEYRRKIHIIRWIGP